MTTIILAHPWLCFFLALCALQIVGGFISLINRFVRGANIRAHGWPPPHCDGDGDFRKEDAA